MAGYGNNPFGNFGYGDVVVTISTTQAGANSDYVKYVFSAPVKTDRINDPILFDFSLAPWDASFVKLKRGAYITVSTNTYGTWFTGYITSDPELSYLGVFQGQAVYGYKYQATSDEYVLNLKPLGLMPPFLNTTQGAILKALVQRLDTNGLFDTTNIQNGQNIARYVVDPRKTFSDIVKEFADAAQYKFWAQSHKLNFQQFDTLASPLTIDGNDEHFTPSRLSLRSTRENIVNDATVIGDIEPQNYVTEYFVGDGVSAQFPLTSSVFGVDSSVLLDDDFSGGGSAGVDNSKWTVYDTAANYLQVSNGFMNALGGPNDNSYSVYLASANLVPLEGHLRLTHGEWDFVSASDGVIGALWTGTPNSSFTGCVFGIRASISSSNTVLNPIANGTVDGTQSITVNYSHRYVMRSIIMHQHVNRWVNEYSYRNANGSVGKYSSSNLTTHSTDAPTVQTWIVEIDPATGATVSTTQWSNALSLSSTQLYALYIPVALNNLHCSFSGVTISTPMQVKLEVKAKGASAYTPMLVGPNEIDAQDGMTPVATVVDSNSGATTRSSLLGSPQWNAGQAMLQFFKDTTKQTSQVPQVGDVIKVTYRRAGASVSRVQDSASVAAEAAAWGDNGLRSASRNDLSPLPRTSAECELAAAALVKNFGYQHYEGSYTQFSLYSFTSEPLSGTTLNFANLPSGFPTDLQAEQIFEVRSTLMASNAFELFQHDLTFGRPDKLQRALAQFAQKTDVFSPQDTAEVPYWIDVAAAGAAFPDDVLGTTLASWDSSNFNFNTNQTAPTGGGFEVRYTDEAWGADDGKNLVTRTASSTFSVPRNARNKVVYVKAYDVRNKLLYSEDLTNAAWVKTGATVTNSSVVNPDGDASLISSVAFSSSTGHVVQTTGYTAAPSQPYAISLWVKGTAGGFLTVQLVDSNGRAAISTGVTLSGIWQRVSVGGQGAATGSWAGNFSLQISTTSVQTVQVTRASLEVGITVPTVYCKTNGTAYGATSRFASAVRVSLPMIPPTATGVWSWTDPLHPTFTITLPTSMQDVWGIELRDSDNTTVHYKSDLTDTGFNIVYTLDNTAAKSRTVAFYVYTYNLLGEYSTGTYVSSTYTAPTIGSVSFNEVSNTVSWGDGAGNATSYHLIVSPYSDYSSPNIDCVLKAHAFALTDADYYGNRYIKVTPSDALGDGTPGTATHSATAYGYAGPNLVPNYDFEQGTSIPPIGWQLGAPGVFSPPTSPVTYSTSTVYSGTQSLRITTTGQYTGITPIKGFKVYPGEMYVLQAAFNVVSGQGSVQFWGFNASGTTSSFFPTVSSSASGWTVTSPLTFVIPAGTYGGYLLVEATSVGGADFYVDAITLRRLSTSTDLNNNVASNHSNQATVDSIDNGTNATIRVYGTGGVGTAWNAIIGGNFISEPYVTTTGSYGQANTYVYYDPFGVIGTAGLLHQTTTPYQTLPDGLIYCGGPITLVSSGGSGGTSGGGGSGGGGGGRGFV